MAWIVATASLLACTPRQNTNPAAQTPTSVSVLALLQPGTTFTNVSRNSAGSYEIIPTLNKSGAIRVYFSASYPTDLRVDIDGAQLQDMDKVAQGVAPPVDSFFKLVSVDIGKNPPSWVVNIAPPTSKAMGPGYTVGIRTVSFNPAYSGTDHESAPLILPIVPRRSYVVSVLKEGSGSGRVASSPAGILCGTTCTFDFGQSQVVRLQPNSDQSSRFNGWSGACTGTGVCNLLLNGTAQSATANFERIDSGTGSSCPRNRTFPGFRRVGDPDCATGVRDAHPTAALSCDAQGFFCCERSTGANSPRCGGADFHEFPADCMQYAPRGGFVGSDKSGCHESE